MSNIPPGDQGRRNFSAFLPHACASSLFYSFWCIITHVQRPFNMKPNSDLHGRSESRKTHPASWRDCSGSLWANHLHMFEFSSACDEKITRGVCEDFLFKLVTLSCSHVTLPFISHIKTADGVVKGWTSPLIRCGQKSGTFECMQLSCQNVNFIPVRKCVKMSVWKWTGTCENAKMCMKRSTFWVFSRAMNKTQDVSHIQPISHFLSAKT